MQVYIFCNNYFALLKSRGSNCHVTNWSMFLCLVDYILKLRLLALHLYCEIKKIQTLDEDIICLGIHFIWYLLEWNISKLHVASCSLDNLIWQSWVCIMFFIIYIFFCCFCHFSISKQQKLDRALVQNRLSQGQKN